MQELRRRRRASAELGKREPFQKHRTTDPQVFAERDSSVLTATIEDGVNADAPVVEAEVAQAQMEADQTEPAPVLGAGPRPVSRPAGGPGSPEPPAEPPPKKLTRFHGTAAVDPLRAGRDASRIADEVTEHLSGLVGPRVELALEAYAGVPEGIGDGNCRTLKFQSFGFEEE